jgi:YesN/AraC family two-component response regulator
MLVITLFAGYRGMLQKELVQRTMNPILPTELVDFGSQASALPTSIDELSAVEESNEMDYGEETLVNETQKYAGSGLTPEQKQLLISKLEFVMTTEKLFVNSNLTVEDVAVHLETRPKHISQVINEHYQRNFYNFINYYRILEAQHLLVSEEFEKYSIQGIAQMVGFVSKSTFNAAFKKQTGKTPSEFKKN